MAKAKPETDLLRLEYVPLERAVGWERNPKRHDVGAIWQSIQKHGFRDPPSFDTKLNAGAGGIVEGNGRSHVLKEMRLAGELAPRGIVVNAQGEWLMPVLFGVDAPSERAAEAYGVDHNNLVLSGGDFGPLDFGRLWDEKAYVEILADLANHDELPVSVDGEDVDALIAHLAHEEKSGGGVGSGSGGDSSQSQQAEGQGEKSYRFGVFVLCENEEEQRETLDELKAEGHECKPLKAYV